FGLYTRGRAAGFDVARDQRRVLAQRRLEPVGELHQVLDQERRRKAARAEHTRRPPYVLLERLWAAALERAGQEVNVEGRVLDAALPGEVAVALAPVGVSLEELVGDVLGGAHALRAQCVCQAAATLVGQCRGRHDSAVPPRSSRISSRARSSS